MSEADTVVTLGDYVDRGPDSKGVIDFLLQLKRVCTLFHLRGNHEIMMLSGRDDSSDYCDWLEVGGDATMRSYSATSLGEIPQDHWDFIETSAGYYETDSHFFVHANAYPDIPLSEQPDFMLFWEFFDNPPRHQSGKTMVCGHTPQESGLPLCGDHAICIDTNAYGGGWLTCLDVHTGFYWQANEAGERRCDFIDP